MGVLDSLMKINNAARLASENMDTITGKILAPAAKAAKTTRRATAPAAGDTIDLTGMRLPGDPVATVGHNGGPSLSTPRIRDPLATVDLPAGSRAAFRGAAPDRSVAAFERYNPKAGVPPHIARMLAAAEDPNSQLFSRIDGYVAKGQQLKGDDWYNTEELRKWYVGLLGKKEGDARWREYIDHVGATSAGSSVPDNLRNASFYNALQPADRARVAELTAQGGITPAAAARQLGIVVPNAPPATGKGSYNYGHVFQQGHGKNELAQANGRWERLVPEGLKGKALSDWLKANPKIKGFANDLLGNPKNIAADKHFMRLLGMADGGVEFLSDQAAGGIEHLTALRAAYGDAIEPYISTRVVKGKPVVQVNLKRAGADGVITDTTPLREMPTAWQDVPGDTEYAALEDMANRLAARYGMTAPQFQANLWMGAGDLTGLADESQGTFMDLFRRTLDKRAGERGISRREMLEDHIRNRAPLAIGGAALGGGLLSTGPSDQRGGT